MTSTAGESKSVIESGIDITASSRRILESIGRNKQIVGSFDEPFQASLRVDKDGQWASSDPLPVPLFDALGYPCVPHVGVYGDEYQPLLPLCLVRLPCLRARLPRQAPAGLLSALKLAADEACELWFLLHPLPVRGPCQHFTCESTSELNVMYHAWALPDAKFSDSFAAKTMASMGVFDAVGISPAHQNLKSTAAGSRVAFNAMGDREIGMHNMRFSPCNAQFELNDNATEHSFWAAARLGQRVVISFHILPGTEAAEKQLGKAVAGAKSLLRVVEDLSAAGSGLSARTVGGLLRLFGQIAGDDGDEKEDASAAAGSAAAAETLDAKSGSAGGSSR